MTFIKAHGVYIAFWVVLSAIGLIGLYWAVRLAIVAAARDLGLEQIARILTR